MSKLIELIKALIPSSNSQKKCQKADLSESSDLLDLERRTRLADIATRDNARSLIFGTMMP